MYDYVVLIILLLLLPFDCITQQSPQATPAQDTAIPTILETILDRLWDVDPAEKVVWLSKDILKVLVKVLTVCLNLFRPPFKITLQTVCLNARRSQSYTTAIDVCTCFYLFLLITRTFTHVRHIIHYQTITYNQKNNHY